MSWFLMNKKKEGEKRSNELKRQFLRAVSKEKDGKLTKDQWLNVFAEAKIHNSTDEVEKMFSSTGSGTDVDGRLSFEEFMGEQSRAERLFRLMDKDGDGFVTKSEFKEVCRNLNKEQIEAAFKKFDQTGNDKLNYREFRDMMQKRTCSTRGQKAAGGQPPVNLQKTEASQQTKSPDDETKATE